MRYLPAVYGTARFPEGTPEEEALADLMEDDKARFSRMIAYPELLLVFVSAGTDARPCYEWYPPELDYRHNRIHIKSSHGAWG